MYRQRREFPSERGYGKYVSANLKRGVRVQLIDAIYSWRDLQTDVEHGDTGDVIDLYTDVAGFDWLKVKWKSAGLVCHVVCWKVCIINKH